MAKQFVMDRRARAALTCEGCGATIAAGESWILRRHKVGGYWEKVLCQECYEAQKERRIDRHALRLIWDRACADLNVDVGKVDFTIGPGQLPIDLIFEAAGKVWLPPDPEEKPWILVCPYFVLGDEGWQLCLSGFRHTCYHEIIHLLLPDAEEKEVMKLTLVVSLHRDGWRYWQDYLRRQAHVQGVAIEQRASLTLWQWVRIQKKLKGDD